MSHRHHRLLGWGYGLSRRAVRHFLRHHAGHGLGGLGWGGSGTLGSLGGWGGWGLGAIGGLGWLGGNYLLPALSHMVGGHDWHHDHHGIIPSLFVRILLAREYLHAAPSVALGAFVFGKGCGLLIGKLLGIRMVLRYIFPQHRHYHPIPVEIKGWRPVRHRQPNGWAGWTGWKPWKLRLNLPFFRRYRHHHSFVHPHHHNYHAYPSIKHIHHSLRTYGTYRHAQDSVGWAPEASHSHDHDSGWKPGPLPGSGSSYESSSGHVYDHGDHHHHDSDGEHSDQSPQLLDYASSSSEVKPRYKKFSSEKIVDIQEFVKSSIVKMGSEVKPPSKEEEAMLNEVLDEEFARDLAKTIEDSVPEFIPLPSEDLVDPLQINTTSVEQSNATSTSTTVKPTTTKPPKTDSMLSSVLSSLETFNPLNFVSESIFTWLKGSDGEDDVKGDTSPKKRGTSNEVKMDYISKSIVKDIKNLFSIINFLDISDCLQKMVCEIHSRASKMTPRQIAASYEGSIVTAFKVIESIMPDDKDESVTKYREAAKLGQQKGGGAICLKNFNSCPVSTNQLVRLGNLVTDWKSEDAKNE